MLRNHSWILAVLSGLVLCTMVPIAAGSGFAILEQSPSRLGTAFAGATANDDDAGAIYWNAAGIAAISNAEVIVGINAILPSADFTDKGSAPVGGDAGQDAGVDAYVPNIYAAMGISDTMTVGVGIYAPYGLKTKYDAGWIGRYAAVETELTTMDINPTLAIALSDSLSVGMGLTAEYADATLTSVAPLGGGAEALATVQGDDWSYGFNLGAMCTLSSGVQVGLSYRSAIEHELDGDVKIGPLPKEGGTADLELPETAAIGVSVPVSDVLSIQADAAWTGWSCFQDLTVVKDDGSVLLSKDEGWEDTWRFALGATYQARDDLVLRAGCAYDQTPVPDPRHRTARIPDADRTWLTVGAGMNVTETLSIDVGYAHLWFDDADIVEVYDPTTGAALVGTYEGEVDILSLQLRWMI